MSTAIAIGPYVGDFTSEIIFFRPYVTWLISALKPSSVYISSHKNRRFLYPDNINFIPIYEDLTRSEFEQVGAIHEKVSGRDYNNIIMKKFKLEVQAHLGSKEVFYYSIPYTRYTWVPEYKRVFTRLVNGSTRGTEVLFIPCDNVPEESLAYVHNKLSEARPGLITLGDMHTWLPEHNIMLRDPGYYANAYQNLVTRICGAAAVICPSSVWTTLCDLHGVRCFSWGRYTLPIANERNINILNSDELEPRVVVDRVLDWLSKCERRAYANL